MPLDQRRDARDGLVPDLVAGNRPQLVIRDFNFEIHLAPVARVHDRTARGAARIDVGGAHQEARHLFDRPLRCAQADARDRLLNQSAQPFHRQGQMGPALVVGYRVDLVQNQSPDSGQAPAPAQRGKQDVQRLGRRDPDVRRLARHRLALGCGRVARPHGHPNLRDHDSIFPCEICYLPQRNGKVFVNVVRQRLQR